MRKQKKNFSFYLLDLRKRPVLLLFPSQLRIARGASDVEEVFVMATNFLCVSSGRLFSPDTPA